MKKIGFIGAQSAHTVIFGEIIAGGVAGLASDAGCLWSPDTPEREGVCQAEGEIPQTCHTLDELLDKCDAALVLLRDGNTHRRLAEEALRRGKPVLVDKPFACSPEDAAAMVRCAEEHQTPLMGGSTLCWLPEVRALAARAAGAREIALSFPADVQSPFGGWCFYGSHLTDLCATVAGTAATGGLVRRNGGEVEVEVEYPELRVVLRSDPSLKNLGIALTGADGRTQSWDIEDYERCYRCGMERFAQMLYDGKSVNTQELLFSVRLLDAIVQKLPAARSGPARLDIVP